MAYSGHYIVCACPDKSTSVISLATAAAAAAAALLLFCNVYKCS